MWPIVLIPIYKVSAFSAATDSSSTFGATYGNKLVVVKVERGVAGKPRNLLKQIQVQLVSSGLKTPWEFFSLSLPPSLPLSPSPSLPTALSFATYFHPTVTLILIACGYIYIYISRKSRKGLIFILIEQKVKG